MTPRRLLAHEDLMTTFRRVHFIGIGGVGMSGIAEVLHNLGYAVSGSDKSNSSTAQRLAALGIVVHVGHAAEHIGDADVVVTSSAIHQDNPELVAARAARIPVVPRAEMLGELMRFRRGIAIAGTHGKTTTTSLTASVLAEANYDPTFVIGGQLNAAGANARLGTGQYIVAEADESNNEASTFGGIHVTAPFSELTVLEGGAPIGGSIHAGRKTVFPVTVRNTGSQLASAANFDVFARPSGGTTAQTVRLGTGTLRKHLRLRPGERRDVRLSVRTDDALPPGQYDVVVSVNVPPASSADPADIVNGQLIGTFPAA